MDEYGDLSIKELLQILKQKTKVNASTILKNIKKIEVIREKYRPSKKRERVVGTILGKNQRLEDENFMLMEMRKALNDFQKTNKDQSNLPGVVIDTTQIEEQEQAEFRRLYFEKTIAGEIKMNAEHPFYSDAEFINELMIKCKELELYELCAEIKELVDAIPVQKKQV